MAACSSNGMQSICLFYFIIIIRNEFEFDDLKYCVLISVLRFTIGIRARLNLSIQNHCFIKIKF